MKGLEQNWLERLGNRIVKPKEWNEKEKLIISIIEEICKEEDSDIKVAPLTGRYFIVNKRLEYWIRINEFEVSITNHKFTLNYIGTPRFHNLLISIVSQSVEGARDIFEQTVFENEVELLQNIKASISSKYLSKDFI